MDNDVYIYFKMTIVVLVYKLQLRLLLMETIWLTTNVTNIHIIVQLPYDQRTVEYPKNKTACYKKNEINVLLCKL